MYTIHFDFSTSSPGNSAHCRRSVCVTEHGAIDADVSEVRFDEKNHIELSHLGAFMPVSER